MPIKHDRQGSAPDQSTERRFATERAYGCRLCQGTRLEIILSLPPLPLAGLPVADQSAVQSFPLHVYLCADCGLVQLLDVISQEVYADYLYTPSHAPGFRQYVDELAQSMLSRFGTGTVLEIGSSDGQLLMACQKRGCDVIGFEPSRGLATKARDAGVATVQDYFNRQTLSLVPAGIRPASFVVIRHVMEHLPDFSEIMGAIAAIIDPKRGVLAVEVPYLGDIVAEKQFYAFFHEHLSYFSLKTMERMLGRFGFKILDARKVYPEGGSMLVYATPRESTLASSVDFTARDAFAQSEALLQPATVKAFAKDLAAYVESFKEFVRTARAGGMSLAAWGAGQRGITLLNLCEFGKTDFQYVIDVNPGYHGLFTPRSDIPIVPPAMLKSNPTAGVIVFATGYLDSIRKENAFFEQAGGRFGRIIPDLSWI